MCYLGKSGRNHKRLPLTDTRKKGERRGGKGKEQFGFPCRVFICDEGLIHLPSRKGEPKRQGGGKTGH